MLSEHTVAEAAAAAGIDAPAHYFDVTGSTNSELVRMAEEGSPEWTILVAGQQEAGRGRLGRTWLSDPGSSLLLSVLSRPALLPRDAAIVTLGAGACMALSVDEACGVPARCKWPNDLVAGERKLGGVLVEAKAEGDRMAYAVIGIGVNMKQGPSDFPEEIRDSATSVAIEGGRPDMGELLFRFLVKMRRVWNPNEPEFRTSVLAAYRAVCDTIGRQVRAMTVSGSEIEGEAVGVGTSGELLVEADGAIRPVMFGEIQHLR